MYVLGGRQGVQALHNDGMCSETWRVFSLGGAADDVVGKYIPAASHGDSHAVLVVLEYVVGHLGVERLHHGQPSVAVVVDVVACRACKRKWIASSANNDIYTNKRVSWYPAHPAYTYRRLLCLQYKFIPSSHHSTLSSPRSSSACSVASASGVSSPKER